MKKSLLYLTPLLLISASWQKDAARAGKAMTPEGLLETIRVLASDEYEGRAPGTPGEEKTVAYLIEQCRKLGLKPGNPDGSYFQNVALWGVKSTGEMQVDGAPLRRGEEYLAWSVRPEPEIQIDSSAIVFAGYGVNAPEKHWNDYEGVDVKGKTVLLLAGDPFGQTLTIHGRTATKADTAWANGAVAVLTVSIPRPGRPAGLGAIAQNGTRENMILRDADSSKRVAAQGMITLEKARELVKDFDALRESAAKPGFRATAIGHKASFKLHNEARQIDSKNVVAKVEGNEEVVIYSGHWDHLGRDGDKIYHGASDNAAGTAGVLELARAFLKVKPKRTVLFLWPTAEEKGLLGAKWYVQYPLYPLKNTVANINLDYFSNWGWGRTHDFSVLGLGGTTLEDYAVEVLKRQGRVITGDTAPSEGFYFRSDHFEFAKGGVPAMEMSPGIEHLGHPAGWGVEKREAYIRQDYHKVSDMVKPDWDLTGSVEDLQVLFEVGYRVSMESARPKWKKRPF
jgi:Zn-dependent M28 family amino/carboxypeptidase